ncbi:hypothetical protein BDZ97DRAFT_1847983 [Flammula alnicola]|nr:hypothetical protein BDZ97DRAFT_1847983 [Flammula alnicola]
MNFCYSLASPPGIDAELSRTFIMDRNKQSYIALCCCHYFSSDRLEMVDFHSGAWKPRMRHVARNLSSFLENAAPRIDVYLSLHKVLAFHSTQEFEEVLRILSISQPISTRNADSLVRYFDLRLRHNCLSLLWESHDLAVSLAQYLLKVVNYGQYLMTHSGHKWYIDTRSIPFPW